MTNHTGIFKVIRQVRHWIGHRPDHNGSENWDDFFGIWPYNDNDVKRERRDAARPVLLLAAIFSEKADYMVRQFITTDDARGWDEN